MSPLKAFFSNTHGLYYHHEIKLKTCPFRRYNDRVILGRWARTKWVQYCVLQDHCSSRAGSQGRDAEYTTSMMRFTKQRDNLKAVLSKLFWRKNTEGKHLWRLLDPVAASAVTHSCSNFFPEVIFKDRNIGCIMPKSIIEKKVNIFNTLKTDCFSCCCLQMNV